MTKKQKSVLGVPVGAFEAAFCKLLKVSPTEIEIQMDDNGQTALVLFQDERYKVATWEAFRDEIQLQLTDRIATQSINLKIWTDVTSNTVTINRFLPVLLNKIGSAEEANILNIALSLNSFSKDQYDTFWKVLANIDKDGNVFSNAVISVREVYNGDGLLDDLTETMIMNGKDAYAPFKDGIFETVYLQLNKADFTFYIYSSD